MLDTLELVGVPAFEPEGAALGPLKSVNIVFGANGSGKTSVSRALHSPEYFSGTRLSRLPGSLPIAIRVFNRDYVARTFRDTGELPGVFVLGDESREAQDERDALEAESSLLKDKLTRATINLGSETDNPANSANSRSSTMSWLKRFGARRRRYL